MNVSKQQCGLVVAVGILLSSFALQGQTVSGKATPLVPDQEGWYALFDGKHRHPIGK